MNTTEQLSLPKIISCSLFPTMLLLPFDGIGHGGGQSSQTLRTRGCPVWPPPPSLPAVGGSTDPLALYLPSGKVSDLDLIPGKLDS